jgi:hypothetical protein
VSVHRYLAGIAAAIGAGLAFNTGLFLQQQAVRRLPPGRRLFPKLLRSPIWLAGFGLQSVVTIPLNLLATALIGPALTPSLIAVGLGVLPLLAAIFEKTRIAARAIGGIVCVVLSAVAIGLSRLSVDMKPAMLSDSHLLQRAAVLIGAGALAAVVLGLLGSRMKGSRAGYLLTLAAGCWLGTTAPAVGFITAGLQQLRTGLSASNAVVSGAALTVAIASSLFGIARTQQAFRHGPAYVLVPIQYLPIQAIPMLSFFVVFRPFAPALWSILLAVAGIGGIVAGSGLLAGRGQERGVAPQQ